MCKSKKIQIQDHLWLHKLQGNFFIFANNNEIYSPHGNWKDSEQKPLFVEMAAWGWNQTTAIPTGGKRKGIMLHMGG